MSQFKKQFIESSRYDNFVPFPSIVDGQPVAQNIKISISKVENSILVSVLNKDTDNTVFDVEIPFDSIKNNSSFAAQTLWCISDSIIPQYTYIDYSTSERHVVKPEELVNMFSTTLLTQEKFIAQPKFSSYRSPVRIFVPFKEATIDDVYIVGMPATPLDRPVELNVELDMPEADVIETWKDLVSVITVTGPTTVNADEIIDLTIQSSDLSVEEIYVEPVSGFVNKNRVALTNGVGTLKVNCLGLEAGDKIDIKLGYKYLTGMTRYIKSIS